MRTAKLLGLGSLLLALTSPLRGQDPPAPRGWDITLGGGAILVPSYPGSAEHRAFPFPLAKVNYRERVYFGPSNGGAGLGLGAYAIKTPQFTVSGEVGFLQDRPADRGDGLAGMDDRSFVGTAAVAAAYSLGPIQLSVSGTQGMNDGAGLQVGAQLGVGMPLGERTMLMTGFSATFADAKQMRRDFGVTTAEAARRQGLIDGGDDRLGADAGQAYAPKSGLHHSGIGVMVLRAVTEHWALIGLGSIDRLSDAAAKSSLVEERTQVTGGLAVGYRF